MPWNAVITPACGVGTLDDVGGKHDGNLWENYSFDDRHKFIKLIVLLLLG